MNVDAFLKNPHIVQDVVPRTSSHVQHPNMHKKHSPPQTKFQWNQQAQLEFSRAVTKIGIVGIKPKAVLKVFDKYGLTGQQIGSHLQKYKMRLVCDYRLSGYEQLENWMIPLQFSQDAELQEIAGKWRVDAENAERTGASATAVSAE